MNFQLRVSRRAGLCGSLLLALLLLGGCLFDEDHGSGELGTNPTVGCGDSPVQQVVDLVNAERSAVGVAALAVDTRLAAAAQAHSEDQAQTLTMSHTGSDGSTLSDRVSAAGYPWSTIGENVAAGQATAQAVVAAWMGSSGHRANILNPSFVHLGVGVAYATGGYGIYWTLDFGRSRDGGMIPPGGCHP
jgi:uncharacterized protein YkwD